jgi:hypothetical protein
MVYFSVRSVFFKIQTVGIRVIPFERQTIQHLEFPKLIWTFEIFLRLLVKEMKYGEFLDAILSKDCVRKWVNRYRIARTFSCAIKS